MKNNIFSFIVLMVIFFFSISFCNWEINPAHWVSTVRFGFVFICPIVAVITLLLISETKKK